ncbi:hypothetical protein [Nocardia pseudobrasiliensis]|uniref:DUF5666 domain-containing protein n=1 Tax=Nocardia pseudobrasiliensis TaxID=45979 RepID=A0A370I052_9NOCA|nr:hypothetical protein [Nocardia pseudobrasiliensis]RDI64133.1 hypothetical protein DFR76_109475 [Nocardia pseudobrasiliensis]
MKYVFAAGVLGASALVCGIMFPASSPVHADSGDGSGQEVTCEGVTGTITLAKVDDTTLKVKGKEQDPDAAAEVCKEEKIDGTAKKVSFEESDGKCVIKSNQIAGEGQEKDGDESTGKGSGEVTFPMDGKSDGTFTIKVVMAKDSAEEAGSTMKVTGKFPTKNVTLKECSAAGLDKLTLKGTGTVTFD